MEFKKEIEKLLFDLKIANIGRDEIEKDLKYSEDYIDQVLAKGGNKRFLENLKSYVERKLQKEINVVSHETSASEPDGEYLNTRRNKKTTATTNLTPVFNTTASAGQALLFNDRPELVIDYVDIPFIGKSDGVIEIVGDSMNPTYVNGTRIAVRKLEEKELVYPNECYYVIDVNYDGRVKRLMKSPKQDHIILHSDNNEYPDVEFHWDKIVAVCKILCRIIKN